MDYLRELNTASMVLRVVLAVLAGGILGLERGRKRHPAGLRTYILVCLGATLVMMTNQYIYQQFSTRDPARLGAQVISGIGFLGAGTIILTGRGQIKGLTTAAGLWAAACSGLAIGIGFYEGAILTTILILFAELVFSKLELRILDHAPEVNLYMEYTDKAALDRVLMLYRYRKVKILNMQITRHTGSKKHNASAIFTLRLNKYYLVRHLMQDILSIDGVIQAEEL